MYSHAHDYTEMYMPTINLNPITDGKLEAVASVKRWTKTTSVDAALDRLIATDPELAGLRQTPEVPAAAAQAGQDKPETAGGTSDDPEAAHAAEARQTAHAA